MTTLQERLEIPMPPRIASLPRDRRGYPIPFIAQWSSEELVLPPVWDDRFGEVTTSTGLPGNGHPILGNMQEERQRKCFLENICQVCGTSLQGKLRFMAGSYALKYYSEPPTCLECMIYAVQVCPGLLGIYPQKSDRENRLRVVKVDVLKLHQLRLGLISKVQLYHEIEGLWQPGPGPEGVWEYVCPLNIEPPPRGVSILFYLIGEPFGRRYKVAKFLEEFGAKD